jgi:hypothetical protein
MGRWICLSLSCPFSSCLQLGGHTKGKQDALTDALCTWVLKPHHHCGGVCSDVRCITVFDAWMQASALGCLTPTLFYRLSQECVFPAWPVKPDACLSVYMVWYQGGQSSLHVMPGIPSMQLSHSSSLALRSRAGISFSMKSSLRGWAA